MSSEVDPFPRSSTVREVARRHNCSPNKLYDEIRAGRLRSFTHCGGRRITLQAELDWIKLGEAEAAEFRPVRHTPTMTKKAG